MFVNIKQAKSTTANTETINVSKNKETMPKVRRSTTRSTFLEVSSPNSVPKLKNRYSLR